jgi:subtilisin
MNNPVAPRAEPAVVEFPAAKLTKAISPQIQQELQASGVAQVIVVLGAPAAVRALAAVGASLGKPSQDALENCFTASELSQRSALIRAGLAPRSVRAAAAASLAAEPALPPVQHFPNLGVMLGTVTQSGLNNLINDPRVTDLGGAPQISLIRPQRAEPAKLSTATTWGLDFLRVPALWKQGLSGKKVKVGHLDTGVDGKHPALKAAVSQFAEIDFLGRLTSPTPAAFDSDEHGTHTAGTIAGRAVNGKSIGVAPGAELCSAMVIEGGQVVARILGGLDWAIGQGVRVISMSLGLRGYLEDFIPIVRILRARGVLPVFAVGNEGPGTSRSPGNYPEALSVGAVDQGSQVPDFSSSQRFSRADNPIVPDVVAPGVNVISAQPNNRYQAMDGTSMATPHIAGLAALLCEAKPSATVAELEDAIFSSCNLGQIPADRGNRGVPDAVKALLKLTNINADAPATSTIKPASKKRAVAKKKKARKKSASNRKSGKKK